MYIYIQVFNTCNNACKYIEEQIRVLRHTCICMHTYRLVCVWPWGSSVCISIQIHVNEHELCVVVWVCVSLELKAIF